MSIISAKPAKDDVIASHPIQSSSFLDVGLPYMATVPNYWSATAPTFRFGVAEEKGPRRTMEDAHKSVFDYAGIHGQGFFAVFDGHAGKEAADWCSKNFHEYLLQALAANPTFTVPDVFNTTFHTVDRSLSKMAEESNGKIHSGCTAVTAFIRIEDENGTQSFAKVTPSLSISTADQSDPSLDSPMDDVSKSSLEASSPSADQPGHKKGSSQSRLKKAFKRLSHYSGNSPSSTPRSQSPSRPSVERSMLPGAASEPQVPPPDQSLHRTLYIANAGDARGVLCRSGRALRLTYDHKGTDKQEAKRIMDSGGFVMSGRVNGVLAVTRSLGDSSMKDFVVGAPYTTETELYDEDELLILACDGIWDVLDDQMAVDLVRPIQDAQEAAEVLVREATQRYTNDNVTVMVIRLKDVTTEDGSAMQGQESH